MKKRTAPLLIALGTGLGALSKWYLVWLFARSSGGATAVGQYSLILAIATPLFVASQLGLRTIFLSSTTRWPWPSFVRLRATGTLAAGLLIVLFLAISNPEHLGLGLAIVLLKSADSALDLQLARLQFDSQLAKLGSVMCSNAAAGIVFASIAVWATGRVVPGVLGAALASALSVAWAYVSSRSLDYTATTPASNIFGLLKLSLPVTASQFLATFLFQVPVLILALTGDARAIGIFAAAAYFLTAANLAGSTMQTILITPWRKLFNDHGLFALRRVVVRTTCRAALVGTLASVPIVIWGPWLMQFIYGDDFLLERGPLALLMMAAVATMVAYVLSVSLNIVNRYYSVTWSMGASCAVAALAGLVLLGSTLDPLVVGSLVAIIGAASRAGSLGFSLVRSAHD